MKLAVLATAAASVSGAEHVTTKHGTSYGFPFTMENYKAQNFISIAARMAWAIASDNQYEDGAYNQLYHCNDYAKGNDMYFKYIAEAGLCTAREFGDQISCKVTGVCQPRYMATFDEYVHQNSILKDLELAPLLKTSPILFFLVGTASGDSKAATFASAVADLNEGVDVTTNLPILTAKDFNRVVAKETVLLHDVKFVPELRQHVYTGLVKDGGKFRATEEAIRKLLQPYATAETEVFHSISIEDANDSSARLREYYDVEDDLKMNFRF